MTNRFVDPITTSFEILSRHRGLLRDTLYEQGLDSDNVDEVMRNIEVDKGVFFSLNRKYAKGEITFGQFCQERNLSNAIPEAFSNAGVLPYDARLYTHQERTITSVLSGTTTILATGTGSGKTEAFLIPLLDYCLKHPGSGVKALIIYPMNALANDQLKRLEKVTSELKELVPETPVTYEAFIGSTEEKERNRIREAPPDILVTNYVMLDWMLTRLKDRRIFVNSRNSLRYIVLDEIHTYQGNKATHLKYLLARLKDRVEKSVVQIGTSATLSREGDGQKSQAALNEFVKPLLGVEEYRFIKAEYLNPELETSEEVSFSPSTNCEGLEWSLGTSTEAGLKNLKLLTGKEYEQSDLEGAAFQDMQQHPFVIELKRQLANKGSLNFREIVQIVMKLLPPTRPTHNVEAITTAYLSAIAFLNYINSDSERVLLDFRLHLFLRNIEGDLKRCIKCGQYHSGKQEFCQECGFPLFYVCKDDIHKCVGKLSGDRLRWELNPESDDRKNTYYVLVSFDQEIQRGKSGGQGLNFQGALKPRQEEIVLDYDTHGQFHLEPMSWIKPREVFQQTIPLVSDRQTYQYLHNLVKAILNFQPLRNSKKVLGFVDNRERASQYALVLQDEFASEFFERYLEFCGKNYFLHRRVDLFTVLKILKRRLPAEHELTTVEQDIFEDLDLWYWRYICTPPRYAESRKRLIELKSDEGLFSELERGLLDIFIKERAIDKEEIISDGLSEGEYIRFGHHWVEDHRGIHTDPSQHSTDLSYPSISLSEQARKHENFVQEYGAEPIARAIDGLVQKEVLRDRRTPDGKIHYYIDPGHLRLDFSTITKKDYNTYEDLRDALLLTADAHSSEVDDDARKEIEAGFKNGSHNVVIATPTLEMGIDIGDLENVLMIGVPPTPANYAQRAGRAGRKQSKQEALIVTFCQENNKHDAYYFQWPRRMVNGIVSPPRFNADNLEVIKQHVRAFILSGYISRTQDLRVRCENIDHVIAKRAPEIECLFGSAARVYLESEFKDDLLEVRQAATQADGSPQRYFYRTGFFPDYAFRRDQIYVVDADKVKKVEGLKEEMLSNYAISERAPEEAYHKFAPGETVFMSGDVYKITPEGDQYQTIPIDDRDPIRSYRYFLASREKRYATKQKTYRRYARYELFVNDQLFENHKEVLGVAYHPTCQLYFINRGCLNAESDTNSFGGDKTPSFDLGYRITRQALVLRFASAVCDEETLYLSLVSALDRTIKDDYDLAESEIRVLVDIDPLKITPEDEQWVYVALYDADGNNNLPLGKVASNFRETVQAAQYRMEHCPQECEEGCYQCTRSYATSYFGDRIRKSTALMFTHYLLGEGLFRPAVAEPSFETGIVSPDITLRLEQPGEIVVKTTKRTLSSTWSEDINTAIFDLLARSIRSEFSSEMETLKIVTSLQHVIGAIDGRNRINKGQEAFARFQFETLRFKKVIAERG